ncbi:MAG TPA: DUF1648 domain-containing protein [Desulfomonilaceae bacterium]|nr:DUF1648 domain-containing protein [Desulfomonilaceae bacterium]
MTKEKIPLYVWLVTCAIAVMHACYYYPQLPAVVASHYGPSGNPDAWSGKQEFATFQFLIIGFVAVFFTVLPYVVSLVPVSLINLPNKEYWLAPERRTDTLRFFRYYPLWFASATMLLIIDVFHQVFLVNMGKEKALGHPAWSIALYMVFSVAWAAGLFLRFRKPSSSVASRN